MLFTVLGLLPATLSAQNQNIQGTVTDADNEEALPGVNILIQGTSIGTTTDLDGNYSLTVPNDQNVLVFSYVGYERQLIEIEGRTNINVAMETRQVLGEDIVVVGYGTRERVNLTGSVGLARSERLEGRSIANVGEGLQGVIPNLNITVPSGDPTQGPSFNIRGYESISGGSPLILVDGIPMNLNRINPNDIESVSVLKDAAAAAIYGARGAFGVILVETKKGQRGERINVSLNSQFSQATPILNMDPITDPHQFVLARNRANQRTSGTDSYDQDYIDGTQAWSENPTQENAWGVYEGNLRHYGFNDYHNSLVTDWQPTQQHDLSISGGGENSTYYVSLGHFNKDGYLRQNNEKFNRNNVLVDAAFDITDWLTLEERVQYDTERSNKPHFYNWDVNINTLARVNPIMPVQFPDLDHYLVPGDREDYEQYIGMYFGGTNFFPYLEDGGRQQFTNNDLFLKQGVTLRPLNNLQVRSDFTFNQYSRNYQDVASKIDVVNTDLTNMQVSNGFSGDDWIDNRNNSNQYYVFNAYAEYEFDQFESHDLTAMVGFNQEWGLNSYQRAQARALITPQITDLNATVGSQHTYGSSSDIAMRGAFYRLNYIFDSRYLVELNGRYDGTSRFPEEDRFGFFPSFSAGWIVSNEGFMSGTGDILDVLKFRASYGTLGNQDVETSGGDPIYYPYIPTMGIGQSPYIMTSGQIPYVNPAGLVSPTLTWESVTSQNVGLDITMFDGKLDLVFDVYSRETKDMLMSVNFPSILGTGAPEQNAADLKTTGWELELNWRQVVNNDFQYNVGLALSDWTAEITKFDNPNGSLSNYREGEKLGEIWGYETVGIFQTEDEVANHVDQSSLGANWRPGDIKYADLDGDGEITSGSNTVDDPGDRKVIGNSNPRGSFGINTGVNYKGFGLSTFFQGIIQRDHWPTSGNWTWFFPFNAGHVENYFITDTWTEDNRDAYFPAAHVSTNDGKNRHVQSRFIQNAGFIRLKNLTLSYDVPISLTERIGLSQAQFFLTGMNLWEYSPIRKPLDPESIFNAGSNNGAIAYPMQRIFTIGTSISL
ncbi:MAG: TonB-dependent receptor [Balneolales bacterium]